ncbi:MAG: type II toxin-antitoxin system Phd/YefM family antitoxin [Sphingomonadaceae bacterium]
MQLSIREAKARLSEAIVAMERGERVVLTRFGKEVAQLCKPEPKKGGIDWDKLDHIQRELGIEPGSLVLPDYFDDTEYSRQVLGLEDDD